MEDKKGSSASTPAATTADHDTSNGVVRQTIVESLEAPMLQGITDALVLPSNEKGKFTNGTSQKKFRIWYSGPRNNVHKFCPLPYAQNDDFGKIHHSKASRRSH